MAKRFTAPEIAKLSEEKIKAVYVLEQSLSATKVQSLACLMAKGEEGKYKVFLQDFIPIKNEHLNFAENKLKQLAQKVRDEVKNFKENKEDIDKRY
jgi:hypothetical protein